MSDDERKVMVHASLFLAGAFELDVATGKLTPIGDEMALQSHNLVIAINGEMDEASNNNVSELACQKLIKLYLDESAKKVIITPNLPPNTTVQ